MPKSAAPSSGFDESFPMLSLANPAVARCVASWERAKELTSVESNGEQPDQSYIDEVAELAFRYALPPLSGEENIRDFIACITHAMVHKIIWLNDCKNYLNAAKIALSAVRADRNRPKSPPQRKKN